MGVCVFGVCVCVSGGGGGGTSGGERHGRAFPATLHPPSPLPTDTSISRRARAPPLHTPAGGERETGRRLFSPTGGTDGCTEDTEEEEAEEEQQEEEDDTE